MGKDKGYILYDEVSEVLPADHDDGHARLDLADVLEQGEPAHVGQLQIEQDQVGPLT